MSTAEAIEYVRTEAAAGRNVIMYDDNPHWSFGYRECGRKFHYSYFCGCGLADCNRDHYEEFDRLEEIVERRMGNHTQSTWRAASK